MRAKVDQNPSETFDDVLMNNILDAVDQIVTAQQQPQPQQQNNHNCSWVSLLTDLNIDLEIFSCDWGLQVKISILW